MTDLKRFRVYYMVTDKGTGSKTVFWGRKTAQHFADKYKKLGDKMVVRKGILILDNEK